MPGDNSQTEKPEGVKLTKSLLLAVCRFQSWYKFSKKDIKEKLH